MTAVQTLPSKSAEPKAKRRINDPLPEPAAEAGEQETPLEWYKRWCREVTEWQRQEGLLDEEPPSMEEIVAICKEARAERYAEKQKNTNCR